MSIFDVDVGPVSAPILVVDHTTVRRNLERLVAAAAGTPLRVATKSVRVRGLLDQVAAHESVVGYLAYSAREAAWLVGHGARDVVIAYPSVDHATATLIAADPKLREQITFMVDLPEHVHLLSAAAREAGGLVRVAFDIDCGLRVGPATIGTHRSSLRTVQDAEALASLVRASDDLQLVGAMFYEAQVAGVPDATPFHRVMKSRSMAQLRQRRGEVVRALSRFAELEFVNGGGTGSVHLTREDPAVTDIAVGSGLFTSTLFDKYHGLHTQPAAWFVSPVVRKPTPDLAVTFSGGYVASGPPGSTRVPKPVHPSGLSYFGGEGAGEVQTPLRGRAARDLNIGDLVWFRHAKAGEVCERFDEIVVVDDGAVVGRMPTYRGEGQNFG